MLFLNCWLLFMPFERLNFLLMICESTFSIQWSWKLLSLTSIIVLMRWSIYVALIPSRVLAYLWGIIVFLTRLLYILFNLRFNDIKRVKVVFNQVAIDKVSICSLFFSKVALIIQIFVSYCYLLLSREISTGSWFEMILVSPFDISAHPTECSTPRNMGISDLRIRK